MAFGSGLQLAGSRNDYRFISHLAQAGALVIFDEAHQAIAPTFRFITEQLTTYQIPLLGLTATPGRTAQIGDEDHELADMFNARKVPSTHEPRQPGDLSDETRVPS